MSKKIVFVAVLVLVLASLACSVVSVPATATPLPTNTVAPTSTPLPTLTATPKSTNTPVPSIPGVTAPVKYMGVSFTAFKVEFSTQWDYGQPDGMRYPALAGDLFMAVYLKYDGDLAQVTYPALTEDSEITFHVEDSNGRVDQWSRFEPDLDNEILVAIFVVDGSAQDYIFTFPNGLEIDLASFLSQ